MAAITLGEWTRHALNIPELAAYDVKHYRLDVDDGYLEVLVGREPIGKDGALEWHLSIAMKSKFLVGNSGPRLPTWDELKDARYRFCPRTVTMAMILPPPSEYVNVHQTTFHLYELEGAEAQRGTSP